MKQSHYMIIFVISLLFLYSTAFSLKKYLDNKIRQNLKGLFGFKCYGTTKMDIPIRIGPTREIECFSIDGKDCSHGFKNDEECQIFIKKNSENLKPVQCGDNLKKLTGKDGYTEKGHWCQLGENYFYKRWHCPEETGLKNAIKINKKTKHVECLSKNGINCIWGQAANQSCKKANSCHNFRSKMKKVKCGKQLKRIYRHNGYFFPYDHWCKNALSYFRYTGIFLCNYITGLNIPIKLTINGDITCLSKDGKNCIDNINSESECQSLNSLNHRRYQKLKCGISLKKKNCYYWF